MFKFQICRFLGRPLRWAMSPTVALYLILALITITATAGTNDGIRLLNDGRPVQVTVTQPARDLNHVEDFSLTRLPERAATEIFGADTKSTAAPPLLQFPVRRGLTNSHPGIYGISHFVDLDPVHPDVVLDYSCGERTYDTATFNHNGIDISPSVFGWLTMDTDGFIVIAAADGTIIERRDGEPDRQCAFDDDARTNLIVLQHDDGSVTIYAHMKNGSVTPRSVGDRVETGDYLGVVGSSGTSTGPHLHFGVQDHHDNRIEPYAGACNGLNDSSWWAQQEDYHVKKINAVRSHSATPVTPPCPQPEVPHYQDEFIPGDTVFLSAFVRDLVKEDVLDIVIRGPSNKIVAQTSYQQSEFDFASALSVVFSVQFPEGVASGAYIFAVTFDGQTMEHTFYINSEPDPLPVTVEANNAYNGAWYDPSLDGEGYNIVASDSGTGVYFYGSDVNGNRLWLISELLSGPIYRGVEIELNMYESTGGVFGSPVTSDRGLSLWGTVVFDFTDCESGVATLKGADGDKVSRIVKITGAAGTACNPGDIPPDAAWSGVWFDLDKDGEGYNLVIAPTGRVLFFYGFKSNGLRLWMISELFSEQLQVGADVTFDMFEATQGDFDNPVPHNDALVKWGTATITLVDCTHATIVMIGLDGSKTSNTILLAGTIGLVCT